MEKYLLINKFSGFEIDEVKASSQEKAEAELYAKHPGMEGKTEVVSAAEHCDDLPDAATGEPEYL